MIKKPSSNASAVTGSLLWDMQGPVQVGKFQEFTVSFPRSFNQEGTVGIAFVVLFYLLGPFVRGNILFQLKIPKVRYLQRKVLCVALRSCNN